MKLRFAVRDLLWGMVVVGLAVGWWVDRSNLYARWWSAELRANGEMKERVLTEAKLQELERLVKQARATDD